MPLRVRALALAVATLVVLAGCKRETHRYAPEVVENFMNACRQRGSDKSCRCALAELERRYSPEEYVAIEAKMRAGEKPPNELLEVIRTCGG
jgi:hypothetical protein